ncbi:hypothetical protein Hanom_Chr09g00830791 [Helianthus anomalus]
MGFFFGKNRSQSVTPVIVLDLKNRSVIETGYKKPVFVLGEKNGSVINRNRFLKKKHLYTFK